jgi:uncharacterized membrane protein
VPSPSCQCTGSLSELVDTIDQDAKDRGRSWWEKFTDSFTTLTTGTIAGIVAALMTLFSKLVAALTPFAIAMARAIAIVLRVLGVYLLLLPGRYADSVKWMVGPIAGANLWHGPGT